MKNRLQNLCNQLNIKPLGIATTEHTFRIEVDNEADAQRLLVVLESLLIFSMVDHVDLLVYGIINRIID
jgi:hypothetical protein